MSAAERPARTTSPLHGTTPDLYDVIVVGARCAGSPTAMLLARLGYRVLLVDRSRFPSDTVSTHLIHRPGIAALRRWGLLDRLVATGCPPIDTYRFDFGPMVLTGCPPAAGEAPGRRDEPVALCPRRKVLDQLLLDAAREAGAEVREEFSVHELVHDGERVTGVRGRSHAGGTTTAYARLVIGADGAHSRVADLVGAELYRPQPMLAAAYYSYWSGAPVQAATWGVRPGRGFGAFPTHDGLTMLLVAWPRSDLAGVKQDIEGAYLNALHDVYADLLTGARREERVTGSGCANHFRVPAGPGWALVGDAGYLKDPVTAQGISDAFLDAELCTQAVHLAFSGTRKFDEAMSEYRRKRDERVTPLFEFTTDLATLAPPSEPMQQLLGAIAGHRTAMDEFAGVVAGTVSPVTFFAPAHVAALVGH